MKPAIVNGKPEKGENCSSIDTSTPAQRRAAKTGGEGQPLHAVDVDPDDESSLALFDHARASPAPPRCETGSSAAPTQQAPATEQRGQAVARHRDRPRCQTSPRMLNRHGCWA